MNPLLHVVVPHVKLLRSSGLRHALCADMIWDLPPAPGCETPAAHFGLWSLVAPAAAGCSLTPSSPPENRRNQTDFSFISSYT